MKFQNRGALSAQVLLCAFALGVWCITLTGCELFSGKAFTAAEEGVDDSGVRGMGGDASVSNFDAGGGDMGGDASVSNFDAGGGGMGGDASISDAGGGGDTGEPDASGDSGEPDADGGDVPPEPARVLSTLCQGQSIPACMREAPASDFEIADTFALESRRCNSSCTGAAANYAAFAECSRRVLAGDASANPDDREYGWWCRMEALVCLNSCPDQVGMKDDNEVLRDFCGEDADGGIVDPTEEACLWPRSPEQVTSPAQLPVPDSIIDLAQYRCYDAETGGCVDGETVEVNLMQLFDAQEGIAYSADLARNRKRYGLLLSSGWIAHCAACSAAQQE